MGSDKRDKWAETNEKPQHTVDLTYDYFIARFPITNEEFSAFLKSEGILYRVSCSPETLNHPVVGVSWSEATAYCRWLNELLRGELPLGLVLRLPTEAEWERAARGKKNLVYPWGNKFEENRNNCDEGGTSPVGAYSLQGDSAYGCADMSGNVWEWTHTTLRGYPYKAEDGREEEKGTANHVARGGCYFSGQGARCASRDGRSDEAHGTKGFRLAVSISLSRSVKAYVMQGADQR